MEILSNTARQSALMSAIRGAIMLLVGVYAIIWPAEALAIIVLIGGLFLVADSTISLWLFLFGDEKAEHQWLNITGTVVSLVLGVLIVFSPFLAAFITASFLAFLAGATAIIVGVVQAFNAVTRRKDQSPAWPRVLWGVCYALLGVLLILFPMFAASVSMALGGILLVAMSIGLFVLAWKKYQMSKRLGDVH